MTRIETPLIVVDFDEEHTFDPPRGRDGFMVPGRIVEIRNEHHRATMAETRSALYGEDLANGYISGVEMFCVDQSEGMQIAALVCYEQCGQCGADVIGYHACEGVMGGFGDDER